MKKILTLTALVISVFSFSQTGMKFEESDFKTVLAKAKKENKLIFLDAYAAWCGPCKLMVKNIFPLQTVGDYYNANFVNVKIDMEKGEGIELAKKFKVQGYPTYLFIDGDGNEVHRTMGYVKEEDFIQFGKDALNPEGRMVSLVKRFEDGDNDPEFLKSFVMKAVYADRDLFEKALIRLYNVNKTEELTKDDVALLQYGISSIESPTYKIYKERKAAIEKVITPAAYTKFENNLLLSNVYKKTYNKDSKTLDETQFLKQAQDFLTEKEAQRALISIKGNIAYSKKDYAMWESLMLEKYKDVSAVDANELNSVSWRFYENVTDKGALQKAILWAQESVKKDQGYHNTDTLAHLYSKTGDKVNAKKWATKSIELAKAEGEDFEGTQKLLESL